MYHINPHNYGQNYFVLAESNVQALEFLSKSIEFGADNFIGKTIDDLPRKYTIDEYNIGEVVRTENA